MALPGTGDRMCITAPADDRKGWTDGPARDPDRVTGSADRHRPRRAPARRATTASSPVPRHPLALTAGRSSGRPATTELPPAIEGLSLLPPRSSIRQTKRRRSSSRRRFVRVRGPVMTAGTASGPATNPTTSFGVRTRLSHDGGAGPAAVLRSSRCIRWDAERGERIAWTRGRAWRLGTPDRALEPVRSARRAPPAGADFAGLPDTTGGRPACRSSDHRVPRPGRGLAPGQPKNNRRTIEERCSSQATGPSVP